MERESFIFYRSYAEAIRSLPKENQIGVLEGLLAYAIDGEEPELSGIERAVFVLMKPQLDANNQRYENGKKGGRPSKEKPSVSEKPKKKKPSVSKKRKTEKPNENVNVNVNVNDNEYGLTTVQRAGAREADDMAEEYLGFMREHPTVREDITNPSEIASIDFKVLSERIAESQFLQTRQSLAWLIGNYSKIVSGAYRDFSRSPASDVPKGKGDLQLWQETVRALQRAKRDVYCAASGYNVPAYKMADVEAKRVMAEIYKSLSREITEYFDPNSFLELCGMEEKDLKFERARFLKSLPEIRAKIAEE